MGAPMCGHLIAAGHQLFVNTVGKVPANIADTSATQCTTARGVAERADIIFIMVPDTPDVEKVLFGEDGVAAGLKGSSGKIVVDMSSISPVATKDFAKRIEAAGAQYLDAPVSGGEVGAKNGTLSIMVGGPDAAFERVKPLFDKMGKNITLVGGNGDGQTQGGQPDHRGAEHRSRGRSPAVHRAPVPIQPACVKPCWAALPLPRSWKCMPSA
jgi:2-hydroxy-3-oxopropionate reductase